MLVAGAIAGIAADIQHAMRAKQLQQKLDEVLSMRIPFIPPFSVLDECSTPKHNSRGEHFDVTGYYQRKRGKIR